MLIDIYWEKIHKRKHFIQIFQNKISKCVYNNIYIIFTYYFFDKNKFFDKQRNNNTKQLRTIMVKYHVYVLDGSSVAKGITI